MSRIGAVVSTTFVLLLVWCGLTMDVSVPELTLGLVLSALIAVSTRGLFSGNIFRLMHPGRMIALVGYIGYFLRQMIIANADVILRVWRPAIPVRPGIVGADLSIASTRGRIIVANSITLTPGTLTVDIVGDRIYVHWISLPSGDMTEETQRMVDGFAKRLEKIIG